MYRFLDREIDTLEPALRLTVLAMRDWLVALHRRRCPADAVMLRFASHEIRGALEPFDTLMTVLARYSRQKLEFGCPCHKRLTDAEALMLALVVPGPGSANDLDRIGAIVCPNHAALAAAALGDYRASLAVIG